MKLGQWFELVTEAQLKEDQATRHTGHVGNEQVLKISGAALLARRAQDLLGTTMKAIESRVRGRPHHRPTAIVSLLRESRGALAPPRLCSVKVNRDRARVGGPDY